MIHGSERRTAERRNTSDRKLGAVICNWFIARTDDTYKTYWSFVAIYEKEK